MDRDISANPLTDITPEGDLLLSGRNGTFLVANSSGTRYGVALRAGAARRLDGSYAVASDGRIFVVPTATGTGSALLDRRLPSRSTPRWVTGSWVASPRTTRCGYVHGMQR